MSGRIGRKSAGKARPKRSGAGLAAWHRKHKDDAKYRAARAAGSRRHLERLYRDAELGRMARELLDGIGMLMERIAAMNDAAREGGAR